jgi:uncharacterized membrane protein
MFYGLIFWDSIPDQVPQHWNFKGEVDRYGSRYVSMLLPLGIYLLMVFLPYIDPRKRNYGIFSKSYYGIRMGIILFLSILNTLTLADVSSVTSSPSIIVIGVLALFTFIGNYMRGIKSNWFVGIKTPWTLDNEVVWNKTHRFASNLWFWGGLCAILANFLFPSLQDFRFILFFGIAVGLAPMLYSYIVYKQQDQADPGQ